eukprot:gnl/TRDRNA2_/TRDRNA2_64144_c0_seq1.p1 gnl/TRDRNA2_/TRDRNA2_64144_c0~~gnl/TRDRNA2_/TRDRNA2_64144_c0_seq1.p1  ORF type:complete len:807 (+),score=111.14 gnl/TRDRNA2_/TRDRNA2_64144_c0_seq1:76-2496(+)
MAAETGTSPSSSQKTTSLMGAPGGPNRELLKARMSDALRVQQAGGLSKSITRRDHGDGGRSKDDVPQVEVSRCLQPELWHHIFLHMSLFDRVVRARATCVALAEAGGFGPSGAPVPQCLALAQQFHPEPMLASSLGCALLSQVKELTVVNEDSWCSPLSLLFPPLPLLEDFKISHGGLCKLSTDACPRLRWFDFNWDVCSETLEHFHLAAGPDLVEMPRPEPGGRLRLLSFDTPGLMGQLDLTGLQWSSTPEISLRCPSDKLGIDWPPRHVVRRVERLVLALSGSSRPPGGRKVLSLRYFSGLRSLTVRTDAEELELPTAATELRQLSIEAPAVNRIDLADWTSFGELRSLELRGCRALSSLDLPMGGELREASLAAGAALRVLRLHLKEVVADAALVLDLPRLADLHLVGCRGLTGRQVRNLLGGCPCLQDLALLQCVDVEDLEIDGSASAELTALDLSKLSRANHLSSLKLTCPRLERLVLPAAPPVVRPGGLQRVVLTCPQLASLDLGSLSWPVLEELRLETASLAILVPPMADAIADFLQLPSDVVAKPLGGQMVAVSSRRLQFLDLSGARRLVSVSLHLTACGAHVAWPQQYALERDTSSMSSSENVELALRLPNSKQPLPPLSPLDKCVVSLDVSGCGAALQPANLTLAIRRWPRLRSLDISGLHRFGDAELVALVGMLSHAAPGFERMLCCQCPEITQKGLQLAACAAPGLRELTADVPGPLVSPSDVAAFVVWISRPELRRRWRRLRGDAEVDSALATAQTALVRALVLVLLICLCTSAAAILWAGRPAHVPALSIEL